MIWCGMASRGVNLALFFLFLKKEELMYISICHLNMYSVILIPTLIVIYKQLYSCTTTVMSQVKGLSELLIYISGIGSERRNWIFFQVHFEVHQKQNLENQMLQAVLELSNYNHCLANVMSEFSSGQMQKEF